MLEDVLRKGFRHAHQRPGLIFLDVLWRAIWLAGTLAALLLTAAWIGSGLSAIEWEDTGVRAANAWIALTVLREYWASHGTEIVVALIVVMSFSVAAWFVLEAVFRSKHLNAGIKPAAASTFKIFLVSNVAKCVLLAAAGVVLAMVGLAGAATLAIVIFAALAFFLTLIDTLIRSDAVELLGTDLIRVTLLIGILVSFEMLVGASCAVILIAGFLHVTRLVNAIVMLGASGACLVFLSLLHSYLLVVRFSAVDIMRGNVVEV